MQKYYDRKQKSIESLKKGELVMLNGKIYMPNTNARSWKIRYINLSKF